MSRSSGVPLVAACLTLAIGVAVADGQSKVAPRKDLYGDALPEGAVARFGSVRLRHAGLASCVFLPGGRTILSAGGDGVLRHWDVATGRQLRAVKLQVPNRQDGFVMFSHVTVSPDGKTLAGNIWRQQIVLWEVDSGKVIKTLADTWDAYFLRFTPDSKELTVACLGQPIKQWAWSRGNERPLAVPFGKIGRYLISHGCYSPDGNWFVVGERWGMLTVYERGTKRMLHSLQCDASSSTISPNGKRLAVADQKNDKGDRETVIRLFDLATGKEMAQFPLGHQDAYASLTFSPDGKALACACESAGRLLNCATGRTRFNLPGSVFAPAFSPDGKTLVTGTDWRLQMWDVATGKERHRDPGDFTSTPVAVLSPDGHFLASASRGPEEIHLWDTTSGRLLRLWPLKEANALVQSLAFSADGKSLAACHKTGLLQFWEVATGKEQRTVQLLDLGDQDYSFGIDCFHLSPDGKYVAGTQSGLLENKVFARVAVWETTKGTLLHQRPVPVDQEIFGTPMWLPDNRSVLLRLKLLDGLALVDAPTGVVRLRLAGAYDCGSVSMDGRLVAGRRVIGDVAVCETATGKVVSSVKPGRGPYYALRSDNRILVIAKDRYLGVWDLATGKERHRLALPDLGMDSWESGFVRLLLLSQDGRRAFTFLADGSALVWDPTPALRPAPPLAKGNSEKEVAAWWADLGSADAGLAYAAVWRLAETPGAATTWLRKHLKPVVAADIPARKWTADLDSKKFATREKAMRQLELLKDAALPAMREALAKTPSLEVRIRLEKLLAKIPNPVLPPETLHHLRAIQVLERIASPEARGLLEELAAGWPYSAQTREAKASLERLARRAGPWW